MNARNRIEEWFRKCEQTGAQLTREDVCFLMVQARHLIETADGPKRYRLIGFYADWIVHSALDRSPVCCEVLRDITRTIAENFNQTSPDITRQISQVIGFPKLRLQLISLYNDKGLPTPLFDYYENWRGFLSHLLWALAGQPIAFPSNPKGRAKGIRDEMLAYPRPRNIAVEALTITNVEGIYFWLLHLSGEKDISMTGPVDIAEAASAFRSPPEATK